MIFLTEYDENKHMRQLFKEGREEGREEILLEKIQKKLEKGKSIEQIAEELEESAGTVRELYARHRGAEGDFCYDKGDWYDN